MIAKKSIFQAILELTRIRHVRCLSGRPDVQFEPKPLWPDTTFFYDDLEIELEQPHLRKKLPDNPDEYHFGKNFSNHMLSVSWTKDAGWSRPKICPVRPMEIHPAAKVLHYAQGLFEGMKAYRCKDNRIRMFRPQLNVERLLSSAKRLGLPTFDGNEFLRCLMQLVRVDHDWVPSTPMSSMYLRPTLFGHEPTLGVMHSTEAYLSVLAGPSCTYFSVKGAEPVALFADPQYVRAWPGGTGDKKLACNYAPTLAVQREALSLGLQQVLWLYGPEQQLTEIGAMNVFAVILTRDTGEPELVTPPLNGLILPGITRLSLLEIARGWNEFKVSERILSFFEVREAIAEGRMLELFACGTAAAIAPISRIVFRENGKYEEFYLPTLENKWQFHTRLLHALLDIYYADKPHPWMLDVD